METVKLSARQLVEFVCMSGSIDSRFSGFERAAEGARIHRKLQKAAGEGYTPEVSLKESYLVESVPYRIEGRADGIFEQDGVVTIDEIKTVTTPVELITEDMSPVHWAQGKVYACIYANQNHCEQMAVQLTYFQVDEELTLRFCRQFSRAELDAFMLDLLTQYAPWAKRSAAFLNSRTQSLSALRFPFADYRTGQRALAGAVYRTLRDGERLLAQAPTGIGKSMSAVFPALKAMGESHGERLFYLTARTTARTAAETALSVLRQHQPDLQLKSITLTAKDKVCLQETRECTPEACPYANGYYDRVKEAMWFALDQMEFTRPALEALAKQFTVCPFELGLDLSLWCDVIVGDYNYLFDPVVSLKRFFEKSGDYLFLVDEAHNLPDRAREMHSASLQKSEVYAAKKLLGKTKSPLNRALTKLNNLFIDLRHSCEGEPNHVRFSNTALTDLNRQIALCNQPMQDWLEEHKEGTAHETMLQLYFALREYLRVSEGYNDNYTTQISTYQSEVRVNQLCLDPSEFVNASLAKGRGAVLFSATLSPFSYYGDILGCPDAKHANLPSPFAQERMGLFCAANISTRYRDREAGIDDIVQYLHTFSAGRTGNYMAFFPSYAYLRQVQERFSELYPTVHTLVQESGMDDEARADFLAQFDADNTETLLAFGVMGGVFGEGIDLVGDRLIGTAIVGVGLPQVNPRQEALRDFFEETRGSGFDYAYRYPGFNKVMQAAGRVIRTPQDKGVVLLIDDRFATASYQRLFPVHWHHCQYLYAPSALQQQLEQFWQE